MPNTLENTIAELAESVLSSTDFFLIDIEIKGAKTPEIWICADGAERSINMDECAEISNELSFLMDAHDVFNGAYRLNVSSPGLNRPLVDKRQYAKNKGRKAKVKYKNEEGYHKIEGILKDISENEILIRPEDETSVELSYDQIVETKIIPSLK